MHDPSDTPYTHVHPGVGQTTPEAPLGGRKRDVPEARPNAEKRKRARAKRRGR